MEPLEGKMLEAQDSDSVSTRLRRIAELARRRPGEALNTLAHHVDMELLRAAFYATRKDGAPGVDGQTAVDYAANLEGNLEALLERFKSGTYRAPNVRRVHIPKGDGSKTRPIGIPTFEDKVLQRAVCMVLGAVYEQDFMDCSYGFRPGRSPHDAVSALWKRLQDLGDCWVLEADIRGFFDTLDHAHLRGILDQRVRDGVLRRQIDKWLKAGVLEAGIVTTPEAGTPQGGVVSPLLANVYLHEVLDAWFVRDIQPRLAGKAHLIRYADDFVIVFSSEQDARRVYDVLPKRFAKYGLTLHPDKTGLVHFAREPEGDGHDTDAQRRRRGFDFLGFTHVWGKSRSGRWVVKQLTATSRFARALKAVSAWCREGLHLPIRDQARALGAKLRGHYQYFGVTGNMARLQRYRREVLRVWRFWLDRRSQKARMNWEKFNLLLQRYPLPVAVVAHSVYADRRAAKPRP